MGLTGPVQPNDIVMRASEIGTTIPGIASLAMKSARKGAQKGVQGIYQLPSGEEPTPEFMNVSQQNLNNQTRQMADMLNMVAPKDEQLAYINEEEAGILKLLGGSGTTENNPAGIPSFFGHGGAMHGGGGNGGNNNGNNGGNNNGNNGGNNNNNNNNGGGYSGPTARDPDGDGEAGTSTGNDTDTDNDGTYSGPTARDPDGDGEVNTNVDTGNNDNVVTDGQGNPVTNTQVNEDGTTTTTNVTFGGPRTPSAPTYNPNLIGQYFGYYNPDYAAPGETTTSAESSGSVQEQYAQDLVDALSVNPQARMYRSMDPNYGYVADIGDVGTETMGGMSAVGTLGNINDRRAELMAKAKANNITSTELNELAQLNEFQGKNPTTGMGFLESLEYQVTNPEFVEGIKKVGPVLGIAAITALAPASAKLAMSAYNLINRFRKNPLPSLRTTIENALSKLGKKEKDALAKSLPSNYKGFGIQGENRGQGEDRREEEARRRREDAERKAREEEENNRKQDRFQRSFANRYFIGPASLDAVRKYATTEGGYNQLTPFYGREKETV